jgi:cytochrome b561
MKLTNTAERYGAIHQLLHWGMAGLVIYALYLGLLEQSIGLHKMLGITVLLLVLPRLIWRKANTEPQMPLNMKSAQKKMAQAAHWLLYVMMIVMPLDGWLMSNAAGYPVSVWGLFDMPVLIEKNKEIRHLTGQVHEYGGWILLGLIVLHVLAALQHQFILKDGLMWRMLPCSNKKAASLNLTEEEKKIVEKAPWA